MTPTRTISVSVQFEADCEVAYDDDAGAVEVKTVTLDGKDVTEFVSEIERESIEAHIYLDLLEDGKPEREEPDER